VLAHLVAVDDGADRKADLGLATQRRVAPADMGDNAREIALSRRQQFIALTCPFPR